MFLQYIATPSHPSYETYRFVDYATCVVAFFSIAWFLWWTRRSGLVVSSDVEVFVSNVLADTISEDLYDELEIPSVFCGTKFQASCVNAAKAEFGYLKRTKSNRMMVRKYLRDHMRRHGVRPSHIAKHLDVIVALSFVPSDSDILAHKIGATAEAHRRDDAVTSMWESFYGMLGHMKLFSSE